MSGFGPYGRLTYGSIRDPFTSGSYSITAAQASFSYTGQAANLTVADTMAAAQASFTYTGQSALLYYGRTMPAAQATFSYTGQATALTATVVNIAFVGSGTGSSANVAGSVAFSSLLNSAGATPTILTGDLVLVFTAMAHIGATADPVVLSSTGYTQAGSDVYANANDDVTLSAFYKFMGGTPDTSVDWTASGAAQKGQAVLVYVFRGVDQTTPLDVTPTTQNSATSGQADPKTITPVSTGAWVVAGGGGSLNAALNNYAVPSNATNTTNYFRRIQANGTAQYVELGGAIYSGWTSGAYNMNAFAGTANVDARSGWSAITIALKPAIAAGIYSMSAVQDSFTYAGQDANLTVADAMLAAQATFTYTGQAANFIVARAITAAQATFAYTGQAANLTVADKMTATVATFIYNGQAANLTAGTYFMAAAQATFSYTGQAALFGMAMRLPATVATFTYAGQAAALARGYNAPEAVGTFTYTGQAAQFYYGRALTAAFGTYTYSGQPVAFGLGVTATATVGTFTYTGQDARALLSLSSFPTGSGGGGPRVSAVVV